MQVVAGVGWMCVYITCTSPVHHSYITRTSPVHRSYIACMSSVGERCHRVGTWQSGARESGKSERRSGGVGVRESGAERKRRKAEWSQRGSPYNHPPSRKASTRCLDRERDRAERD